ncbi:MAG: YdcF family protein [Cytophagales bacterium]|nr:YdcF family protein [Cytophagales bacterium]
MITAVSLFFIFGNQYIIQQLIWNWEMSPTLIAALPKHDIGIVLGGGIKSVKKDPDRVTLNAAGDRVMQAVYLYKIGKINKILYSGGEGSINPQGHEEAVKAKILLNLLGIPDSNLIIESKSKNTYENAAFTAKILQKYSNSKLLLITSGIHMRRSLACFAKQGLNTTPYTADIDDRDGFYGWGYYIFPSSLSFLLWDMYLHEVIGYFSYYMKGYV